MQGQDSKDVDAIGTLQLDKANLSNQERVLLSYVKILTLEPAKVRDTDVQMLRDAGWNDSEIFEASFDTALFAFFNRMADAYGLDYSANRWLPPSMRPLAAVEKPRVIDKSAGDDKPAATDKRDTQTKIKK